MGHIRTGNQEYFTLRFPYDPGQGFTHLTAFPGCQIGEGYGYELPFPLTLVVKKGKLHLDGMFPEVSRLVSLSQLDLLDDGLSV
jgi:hypothetical protein